MSTLTSGPKGLYPDQTFIAKELLPEALIFKIATIAGSIEGDTPVIRVPYISVDPTSVAFTAEGADITPGDPTLSEITIPTSKITLLSKISREAASYSAAGTLLSTSMTRAVTVKGNSALLANPITAGQPTGLPNIVGVVDGGTMAAGDLDVIADAITTVEVNGGTATHIVIDPASFGVLRTLKVATGSNLPLLGAPGEQTGRTLFGVPLIVSASQPAGSLIVVDQSNVIAAVSAVTSVVSDHFYLGSDSRAVLITWRIGWKTLHANRTVKVAVTLV